MAKTIWLPDGGMETLFADEDFYRLLNERVGADAACIARTLAEAAGSAAHEIICEGDHYR